MMNEQNLKFKETIEKALDGDGDSLATLGNIFFSRHRTDDQILGLVLLEKAATKGSVRAYNNLAYIYSNSDLVEKDPKKVMDYYLKAAEANDESAINNLGLIYKFGRDGYPVDIKKANEYFQKAADLGSYRAQFNIGYAYLTGNGVEKDINKAVSYLEKSAEHNYPNALYNLARCYKNGVGVVQDINKYFDLLSKAAKQKHNWSLYEMGHLYEHGYAPLGIEKDLEKAKSYYQQAAENKFNKAEVALQELEEKENRVKVEDNKTEEKTEEVESK